MDIIIGIHSISEALKNPKRESKVLYCTDDGELELQKKGNLPKGWKDNLQIIKKAPHALQELAKEIYQEEEYQFQRVPSQVFLTADGLPEETLGMVYPMIAAGSLKLLLLDQVTDIHNMAAIIRSASFYGVSAIVISRKGGIRLSPGFFRIASGAAEHIPIVNVASLSRAIKQLLDKELTLVGLSEHSTPLPAKIGEGGPLGLVLGSEETGLSHAVMRILDNCYALESQGNIKSLNVSVAAAVSMEKFFT